MVAPEDADVERGTRERLLREGMRLFAERGYRATTVGDIEAAAGLQPRRGALYKHFPSKQALLDAAVARHLEAVDAAAAVVDEVAVTEVRAEALLLGHWLLAELDAERQVIRVLEHEGARLDALRRRVRDRVSDAGYRAVAQLVRRWAGAPGSPVDPATVDADAWAVVLLGSLVNARRSAWLFGRPPLALDDERIVTAWADLCDRSFSGPPPAPPTASPPT